MGMAEMTDVKQHISEGESLLIIAESLKTNGKPLPGSLKLTNRIKSELRYLFRLNCCKQVLWIELQNPDLF